MKVRSNVRVLKNQPLLEKEPECVYYQAMNIASYRPEYDEQLQCYVIESMLFEPDTDFLGKLHKIIQDTSVEKITIESNYVESIYGEEIKENEILFWVKYALENHHYDKILEICGELEVERILRDEG